MEFQHQKPCWLNKTSNNQNLNQQTGYKQTMNQAGHKTKKVT